jgi:hypothetical protein
MSEIPKELISEAADIVITFAKGLTNADALIEAIARDVLRERERCAEIADRFAAKPVKSKTPDQNIRTTQVAQTGRRIAAAIRAAGIRA